MKLQPGKMNKEQVVMNCEGHDPKQMTAKIQTVTTNAASVYWCVIVWSRISVNEHVLRPPMNLVVTGATTDFLIGHMKATLLALCFGRLISKLFLVMGPQIRHH